MPVGQEKNEWGRVYCSFGHWVWAYKVGEGCICYQRDAPLAPHVTGNLAKKLGLA